MSRLKKLSPLSSFSLVIIKKKYCKSSSQHASLMHRSCPSQCLCLAVKTCHRGLTSQFLHLSRSGSPIVVPRLDNEEWDGREHRDTSSSYVRLPFLSSHLPPCRSGDRYATAGRAMEVWINLTTAGSNCGGTEGGGAWRLRTWKEKRAGERKDWILKHEDEKDWIPRHGRKEEADESMRFGTKMIQNYLKLYLQNAVWVVMDSNTPNRNAK